MSLLEGSINWFKERLREMKLTPGKRALALRAYKVKVKEIELNYRPQAPRRRRMRNAPRLPRLERKRRK